jgi:hypothetical protein
LAKVFRSRIRNLEGLFEDGEVFHCRGNPPGGAGGIDAVECLHLFLTKLHHYRNGAYFVYSNKTSIALRILSEIVEAGRARGWRRKAETRKPEAGGRRQGVESKRQAAESEFLLHGL